MDELMWALVGIIVILLLVIIVYKVRELAVNWYVERALELNDEKERIKKYRVNTRRAKSSYYHLFRYERIKHGAVFSQIPEHFDEYDDGLCWHYSTIATCNVLFYSGLLNRYICLLLDDHHCITNDSKHADDLGITKTETISIINRGSNRYSSSIYVRCNLLESKNIESLRAAGVEIKTFRNGYWIQDEIHRKLKNPTLLVRENRIAKKALED
ncbi:hypothetical protein ACHELK_004448 [Vibrio vulnificus]